MKITADMKIADVIGKHPELLHVLVAQSPAFQKLKNPLLRRTFAKLVTVEQAASLANMPAQTLLEALNRALGEEYVAEAPSAPPAAAPGAAAPEPPPPWLDESVVTATLDARPFQTQGKDPFSEIMRAVAPVQPGQIFRLQNTFPPLPLYEVLGRRGFVHWARQEGPEDWTIYFFNSGSQAMPKTPPTTKGLASEAGKRVSVDIDVSELVPPEPMMKILAELAKLSPGDTLVVHHVRRPMYLYAKLEELGYAHETRELGPNKVDIIITKK
jgi:uncharacterized protein (DUF2249 family)